MEKIITFTDCNDLKELNEFCKNLAKGSLINIETVLETIVPPSSNRYQAPQRQNFRVWYRD